MFHTNLNYYILIIIIIIKNGFYKKNIFMFYLMLVTCFFLKIWSEVMNVLVIHCKM